MGFGGNLVQGFRAYAWRAVPSFPQITLWGPSLAFWPQPFKLWYSLPGYIQQAIKRCILSVKNAKNWSWWSNRRGHKGPCYWSPTNTKNQALIKSHSLCTVYEMHRNNRKIQILPNIKPIQYSNGKSVFRGTVKSNKKSHRQSCYWSPHHTHPQSSDNRGRSRSRSRSFLLYISGTNLCKCDNIKPLENSGGFWRSEQHFRALSKL